MSTTSKLKSKKGKRSVSKTPKTAKSKPTKKRPKAVRQTTVAVEAPRVDPRDAAGRPICPSCLGPAHVGDSEEPLIKLDPEAAVFYDRDVAETERVIGLCGPRFRLSGGRLHAHYGRPFGARYTVFAWSPVKKSWEIVIENP